MNKLCPLSAAAPAAAEGEGMRVIGKTKGASRLSAREGGDEAEDKEILPTTRARTWTPPEVAVVAVVDSASVST